MCSISLLGANDRGVAPPIRAREIDFESCSPTGPRSRSTPVRWSSLDLMLNEAERFWVGVIFVAVRGAGSHVRIETPLSVGIARGRLDAIFDPFFPHE